MKQVFMRVNRTFLFVLVSLAYYALPLSAFQMTPMTADIDPTGSTATTTFELNNNGDTPVAIEIKVSTRTIDEFGQEFNVDASDQIQIFPSQVILPAGTGQTIRARWIGRGIPDQELPFRVTAEQLPINLTREERESSGVQFMLRYRATLYVRPPGVAADIEIVDLNIDDPERITLTVRNNGSAHQLFSGGFLVLKGAGSNETEIPLDEIDAFMGVNVLPGATRHISIPREQLPFEPTSLELQFN